MIPLGSLTADQEFVNGTVIWAPLSGASGFGAAGPAATATEPLPTRASATANKRLFSATRRCIVDMHDSLAVGNGGRPRRGRYTQPPFSFQCAALCACPTETLVPRRIGPKSQSPVSRPTY